MMWKECIKQKIHHPAPKFHLSNTEKDLLKWTIWSTVITLLMKLICSGCVYYYAYKPYLQWICLPLCIWTLLTVVMFIYVFIYLNCSGYAYIYVYGLYLEWTCLPPCLWIVFAMDMFMAKFMNLMYSGYVYLDYPYLQWICLPLSLGIVFTVDMFTYMSMSPLYNGYVYLYVYEPYLQLICLLWCWQQCLVFLTLLWNSLYSKWA